MAIAAVCLLNIGAEAAGWIGATAGIVFVGTAATISLAVVILWYCHRIDQENGERLAAVGALQHAHDVLRNRVAELTRDVAMAQEHSSGAADHSVAIEELAAQLAAASAELEAFAYSVSHDLRAPLRSIDGFSRELEEQHAEMLGPGGRHYVARIRAATQRMGKLIDAMLEMSRLSRTAMHEQPVDVSALAMRIADDFRMRGAAADFRIEPGLTVYGDLLLLRAALENLLGNAVKFSSRREAPVIEFGSEIRDDERVFYVRDNGVGFDPAYAGKLFTPFERMHRLTEFEGTGIGLAIVARVIARHGGRVWADAAPGKGAIFFFTISSTQETAWPTSSSSRTIPTTLN